MDSPCHHCPKCPCKEHDTCKDYLDFRAEIERIKKEKLKSAEITDYTCRAIEKQKRRSNKK